MKGLALFFFLQPAALAQEEEPLYLANVGITLVRPGDWSVPRWSDDDLDATEERQGLQVHVHASTYQVPATEEAARAWALELAVPWLERNHQATEIEVVEAEVVETEGPPHARTRITYRYQGQQPAVAFQESFPVRGQMAHVLSCGLEGKETQSRRALQTWVESTVIERSPEDISDLGGAVSSGAGFFSTLPEGWRRPLEVERLEVAQVASMMGQKDIGAENCWVGIRPHHASDTALLLACRLELYLGRVDIHSSAAADEMLRSELFRGMSELAEPEEVDYVEDRLTLLYGLPTGGEMVARVAVTPYDKGLLLTYGLGRPEEGGNINAAMQQVLEGTTFSGPDGAVHPVGLGAELSYWFNHRRSHPLVWGSLGLLALLLLLGLKKVASRPSYEDLL